jgi:tRNA-2-methylthio-N6-dimethylallyladenosine synthase
MSEAREMTYFLETFGCQMNVLDSQLVAGSLRTMGYRLTGRMNRADLVLFNTCSVRQHAEDKVYARLGILRETKRERPEMVIGVIGCMAERDAKGILRRMPHVDLLCGPSHLNRLSTMIQDIQDTRRPSSSLSGIESRSLSLLDRASEFDSLEALDLSRNLSPDDSRVQAYIRVQRGCDKFCTFCVVPFVRGKERSRPPTHIVNEAQMLSDQGVKEITLLGQTVNSYMHKEEDRPVGLARLLERVHKVEGIERIRFVTSYPADFTDDILEAMHDLPKVCEYLHVPAQSGSNRILRAMRRNYSVRSYLEFIDRARTIVPNISLAGDFIVGFPGETDADYEKTVELVERIGYKGCFVFKYSERPGTAGARNMSDDIPEKVKRERNNHLLAVQNSISLTENRSYLGRRFEILVEGPSRRSAGQSESQDEAIQMTGRTRGDRIVVFDADPSMIGHLVDLEIVDATAVTLFGRICGVESLRRLPLAASSELSGCGGFG